MTKPGVKRYELSPEIQRGLRAEAALLGISERALLEKLVLAGLSQEAKEFVGLAEKSEPPNPKKRYIEDDPNAIKIIKELYGTKRNGKKLSYDDIAKEAKWPKSTVAERIKKMIAAGELTPPD